MTWSTKENPDQTKPFVDHLEDLRITLIHSICLLAAGMLVATPLAPYILRLVKLPLSWAGFDPDSFLRVIRVTGGLSITVSIVFWGGLLISLPFIVLVVSRFMFPGLKENEKRMVCQSGGFAVALFAGGLSMGYFLVLPAAVQLIFSINSWLGAPCEFIELGDYISFVLRLLLAFGLAFEMPVIVVILGRLGVVSLAQLRKGRRYVVVGILVIAMLLTPPDPLTQLLMALPLILLYEICIGVIWFSERGKQGNADR